VRTAAVAGRRPTCAAARRAERDELRERAGRQRRGLRRGEQRVRLGRPAHGLGGVVDEDVQRPLRADRVGERHDLGGVTQVDADDAQPIQPVGAVAHRRKAPRRVTREARRDRRVRAVAQQPQRDVHPDLRAAAGEQRPPAREIRARARRARLRAAQAGQSWW
jgi:hypothetical protein